MIHNVASSGVHAADITALRQHRVKKTESVQDATIESGKTRKPSYPAHPHGHIPPGLARAAEKIASKIFARADADGNGTVTQQELSAVHSRHARTLASSDLFQTNSTETPTDATTETAVDTTSATSDAATDTTPEATTETSTQVGITEAQLKEALTKFFYAKVGVIYTPPAPPTSEQSDPTVPADTTTPPVVDPVTDESASNPNFIAVA